MKVKNPANNLNVFELDYSQFKGVVPEMLPRIIVVSYHGKNGVVYAWRGYSDEVIARAGGFGYDKIGTAFEQAITKILGYQFKTNGAAGVNEIIEEAATVGLSIKKLI